MNSQFEVIFAVIIGLLSVARTARLIVFDKYPPMAWLRAKWDDKIGEEGWGKLIHCPFCATPYLAAGLALWAGFALSDATWTDVWSSAWWWVVVNGTWGLSYVSAMIVAYDQPE